MNDITELTLDELIALDVLPLEEAKDEGWDVLMDGATKLVEAGYRAAALPYLKEAANCMNALQDHYLSAYSLLSGFSHMKVADEDGFTRIYIENKLLRELIMWCHCDEGDA